MSLWKHEEITKSLQLKNIGKFKEALKIVYELQKGSLTPNDQLLCNLITSTCLNRLGHEKDALKYTNKTYQESQEIGTDLQIFEASIQMGEALAQLERVKEALDVVVKIEELFNSIPQEPLKEHACRKASIAYLKGFIYFQKAEWDLTREYTEESLNLFDKLGHKRDIARCFTLLGGLNSYKGNIVRALEYLKKSKIIEEDSYNANNARTHRLMGNAYSYQGDFDRAIEHYRRALEIAKEINSKIHKAANHCNLGVAFHKKGDISLSIEHLSQSIELYKQIGHPNWSICSVLDELFQISLEKNDLEQAQHYLDSLEQIYNQDDRKNIRLFYLLNKAIMLKTKPRSLNLVKAEEILKQIISEEIINYEFTVNAFLNLCDLLLIELRNTGDLEVLDELRILIAQMLDLAEKNCSYLLMAESYLLHARLALATLNIKEARRYMTQAQQIAERWDLSQLAIIISNEHEELLKQLNKWQSMKESSVPLTERLKLSRFGEQMESMLQNRAMITTQITEDTVTIHKERKICLVCKGEALGFLYGCECGAIYCENCARALTNLENACWVCNAPIDVSKPVKPYKEDVVIKENIPNESKKKQDSEDINK